MLYSKRDTARHSTSRHITSHTTRRVCRVVTCRDLAQQVEFWLIFVLFNSRAICLCVWLVRGYVHVFVLLSVVIVTVPFVRRWLYHAIVRKDCSYVLGWPEDLLNMQMGLKSVSLAVTIAFKLTVCHITSFHPLPSSSCSDPCRR